MVYVCLHIASVSLVRKLLRDDILCSCMQVMASHHSLLDRQALLLRVTEPLTEADRVLLQASTLTPTHHGRSSCISPEACLRMRVLKHTSCAVHVPGHFERGCHKQPCCQHRMTCIRSSSQHKLQFASACTETGSTTDSYYAS